MGYRVPPSEVLAVAISEVLRENTSVTSQHRFAKFVLEKLRQIDERYTVTEERVRREGIRNGLVRVDIEYRETQERSKMSRCPVCGSRLRRKRNRTIYGGSVTLGYHCPYCPFSMGRRRRVPVRYAFSDALPRERTRSLDRRQRTL